MADLAHVTCQHVAYRLSCAEYEVLLARAAGRCEICGASAASCYGGKLVIDHDHSEGFAAARGLLCRKCNSLMRYVDRGLKQDVRATAYLARVAGE